MTDGSKVRFSIARWSSWTPDKKAPGERPEIPELPMMLRRRASFADRLALRVAFDCAGLEGRMPTVFCSRFGEVHSSVELLESLAKGDPFSPMLFGLSVHNAAAALFSIARRDMSPTSALAAGQDSLAAGVFEACALLGAGAPRVLLVSYDDRLPKEFERFAENADRAAALGLLIEPPGKGAFSLELRRGRAPDSAPLEPQILAVARFLELGGRELEIDHGARRWLWRRDD